MMYSRACVLFVHVYCSPVYHVNFYVTVLLFVLLEGRTKEASLFTLAYAPCAHLYSLLCLCISICL